MKLSEQVGTLLQPFSKALGDDHAKIVRDMSSFLGSQQITTVEGAIRAQSGLTISRKDSHKMQLPPNNPLSHLFWFAVRVNEVLTAGKMTADVSLPETFKNWLEHNRMLAKMDKNLAAAAKS